MRYLKQHPDLPTVECETCEGVPQQEGWTDHGDGPEPNGSWWDCPTCNGTGRVSPYWPMIGDEVGLYGGSGIIVTIDGLTDPIFTVRMGESLFEPAGHEALTLIRPCLDTPERQALQRNLEK